MNKAKTFGKKEFRMLEKLNRQEQQPGIQIDKDFQWLKKLSTDFDTLIYVPLRQLDQSQLTANAPQRCMQHSITYSIYCQVCRKPLCASCMYQSQTHRKHHVIPIDNSFTNLRDDMKGLQVKINKMLNNADDILKKNSDCIMRLEKMYNPLMNQLDEFYQALTMYIKKKQKEHTKYLRQAKETMKCEIELYSKELMKMNSCITQKFKSFSPSLKNNQILHCRNLFQTLLMATSFFTKPGINYDQMKFQFDVDRLQEEQNLIKFRLDNLIPKFQSKLSTKINRLDSSPNTPKKNVTFDMKKTFSEKKLSKSNTSVRGVNFK